MKKKLFLKKKKIIFEIGARGKPGSLTIYVKLSI